MGLEDDLKSRLSAALGTGALNIDMLAAYDELHVGGRVATDYVVRALEAGPEMKVLDIGSGLGGAARYLADQTGAMVTGIDVDPDYCAIADMLSLQTGMGGRVRFDAGDALDMPYPDNVFDAAYSLHTAMNIADKERLYKEVARVLKVGARFVLYDVLAGGNRVPLSYPLPWSTDGTDSFLIQATSLEALLRGAGFDLVRGEDRTGFARQVLARVRETGKTGAIGIVHSEDAMSRITNLSMAIDDSCCEVWQFTCLLGSS